MDLDLEDERKRLIDFLHARIPAILEVPTETVFKFIGGYPGVLYRWTAHEVQGGINSIEDLTRLAEDAQNFRFREIEDILSSVETATRKLAARLALVPSMTDQSSWDALKSVVLADTPQAVLDDLKKLGILEAASPPSFGHVKRWEAAVNRLVEYWPNYFAGEAQDVARKLAAKVPDIDIQFAVYIDALAVFLPIAQRLPVDDLTLSLSEIAASTHGQGLVEPERLFHMLQDCEESQTKDFRPLLAFGLFDVFEEARTAEHSSDRDRALDKLRCLARNHPSEPAISKALAMCLFNLLNASLRENDRQREEVLLAELRALRETNSSVSNILGMALVNALTYGENRGDLPSSDALLEELARLARAHPANEGLKDQLLSGINNTLQENGDPTRLEARIRLLHFLTTKLPFDQEVRKLYCKALYKERLLFENTGEIGRRRGALNKLRLLAQKHSEDTMINSTLMLALTREMHIEQNSAILTRLHQELRKLPNTPAGKAMIQSGMARLQSGT